jgi:hypothetical protein
MFDQLFPGHLARVRSDHPSYWGTFHCGEILVVLFQVDSFHSDDREQYFMCFSFLKNTTGVIHISLLSLLHS